MTAMTRYCEPAAYQLENQGLLSSQAAIEISDFLPSWDCVG